MEGLLSEFYDLIDLKVQDAWSDPASAAHLNSLSQGLADLCEKVIQIGTYADEKPNDQTPSIDDRYVQAFIHYEWMREAKSFLILWRDILFQYQKGQILLNEGEMTSSGVEYLFDLSKERMEEAMSHMKGFFDTSKKLSSEKAKIDYLETQALRTNPWSLYQEQINTLVTQSHILLDKHEKLQKTVSDIDRIHTDVENVSTLIHEELKRIEEVGEETITIIKSHLATAPQKIIKHIESTELEVLAHNYYSTYINNTDDALSEMISDIEVPKKLVNAQIQYKEINFQQSTQLWLEGEVQPLIREAQDVLDNTGNGMRMALTNVKNRIMLSLQDNGEDALAHANPEEIFLPIVTSIGTIEDRKEQLDEYHNLLTSRLQNQLNVCHVYSENQNFLDTSQQYRIGQINLDQTAWVQKLKSWILDRAGFVRGFMANVAQEESLSPAEKIVRYVKSRKHQEENHQYNNIFSAEGYIGESFWVGREKELAHAVQLINDWRSGFRGSVIISGKRFCGKTVFGELIAHRHFPTRTIRIQPYSTLKIDGRTFEVNDDIGAAISFVKKYTLNEKYLVWIDDLELWQSPDIPMSRNVRALIRHIDDLSSQLFFMVSMSNWFKHHYSQMLRIDKVFQSKINLDYMPEEEVREAIMIRHGATHKLLVNDQGEKVLPQAFSNMVKKVSNLADHNIGQALNNWSYFTFRHTEDQVIHDPSLNHQLPDFINEENGILLRAILMAKRTNEYRLRKRLGISFKNKYKAIVQRLINLGVLSRHVDGLLEINEGVVNDLAALLHDARYLKYKG